MIKSGKYKLNAQQYIDSYKNILLIRRFEEKCGQLYGMGLIGGFCHLYIGQEAIITGIEMVKEDGCVEEGWGGIRAIHGGGFVDF